MGSAFQAASASSVFRYRLQTQGHFIYDNSERISEFEPLVTIPGAESGLFRQLFRFLGLFIRTGTFNLRETHFAGPRK